MSIDKNPLITRITGVQILCTKIPRFHFQNNHLYYANRKKLVLEGRAVSTDTSLSRLFAHWPFKGEVGKLGYLYMTKEPFLSAYAFIRLPVDTPYRYSILNHLFDIGHFRKNKEVS